MSFKKDRIEFKNFIGNQIIKLNKTSDTEVFKISLKETQKELERLCDTPTITEYKKKTVYQENDFSSLATNKSILKAKENAIEFLENLLLRMDKDSIEVNSRNEIWLTEEIACNIINRVLENFYLHIKEMYQATVHGSAVITREKLNEIKIGNEYDVQRMLYSILKPIFPESRLEVSHDTGYGAARYDIFIEKYNVVIEVKCSRPSINEKKLREEIGSDIFHYKHSNIFFFIYDKSKIITNKTAFVDAYTKEFDDKEIKTIVIQPIEL